ncbi:MAG: 3-phosphoglycerate dehydrogenase [Sulfurospirillum sp.]|nr:MAG: 3-phosphoglycerate dehydrogenase [Sulfurospirillum sp.]
MYKILTLNKISDKGLRRFGEAYEVGSETENPDAIVVRSFKMHDMAFGDNLKAIARAGAGVNNIPLDRCTEQGIVVFNTPGANANAVKEIVLASLLLASRDIIGGVNWVQTLDKSENISPVVEKNKSNFAGTEIQGKTLGVIGLGAIGAMVSNSAIDLGMKVVGYDPYLSVDGALYLSNQVKKVNSLDEVYAAADYITIHVPLLDSTADMINSESLAKCKEGVKILNFSRDGLVNTDDILEAIEKRKVSCYVTDFPEAKLLGTEGVIPIPHLGASTAESEENCAVMAVDEIKAYLENGNIINSVNFPNASMPRKPETTRIVIASKNVPGVIENITSKLAKNSLNIVDMLNKSRGDTAYNIIDITGDVDDTLAQRIESLENVIFARIL